MNRLLEEYVAEVSRRLWMLTSHERVLETDEIRGHLTELAEVHRERGASEDDAAREAIRQFGVARDVSRRLITAHWRGITVWRETLLAAGAMYGTALVLGIATRLLLAHPDVLASVGAHECIGGLQCFQMILSALVAARLAPRFAHRGAALWGLISLILTLYALYSYVLPHPLQPMALTADGLTCTRAGTQGPVTTLISWGYLVILLAQAPCLYLLTRLFMRRREARERRFAV